MRGGSIMAAQDSLRETKDQLDVMWNDKMWLTYFPLDKTTVLDYFSLSQFYDRRCNNELIKMQRLDPALLQTLDGLEYVLAGNPAPNLFVVSKQLRTISPPSVEPLAVYYIVDGNVYQAPSAHAVLSSRVLQSLHHLRGAFACMQAAERVDGWSPSPTEAPPEPRAKARASAAERQAVDNVLYDILAKNRKIAAANEQERLRNAPPAPQPDLTGADPAQPPLPSPSPARVT